MGRNFDDYLDFQQKARGYKITSNTVLLDHSCTILLSFKIVVIFNIKSVDFVLMSADVVLKMTRILREMKIEQLWSKSGRTLLKIQTGKRANKCDLPYRLNFCKSNNNLLSIFFGFIDETFNLFTKVLHKSQRAL